MRDFKDGKIFREFPLISPDWEGEFNLKLILKEEPIHIIRKAVLLLINIQQLEERKNKRK